MAGTGFWIARSQGVEGMCGNLRDFPINPSNSTPIYHGDLVTLNGGYVEAASETPGTKYLGIFWGGKYVSPEGSVEYMRWWDGGANRTEIMAQIAVLPAGATALVKGEEGANYTEADIGMRKSFISNGGNTRTGKSNDTLGSPGGNVADGGLVVLKKVDFADSADYFEVTLAADSAILHAGAA
jgi:hypothetical protein